MGDLLKISDLSVKICALGKIFFFLKPTNEKLIAKTYQKNQSAEKNERIKKTKCLHKRINGTLRTRKNNTFSFKMCES